MQASAWFQVPREMRTGLCRRFWEAAWNRRALTASTMDATARMKRRLPAGKIQILRTHAERTPGAAAAETVVPAAETVNPAVVVAAAAAEDRR